MSKANRFPSKSYSCGFVACVALVLAIFAPVSKSYARVGGDVSGGGSGCFKPGFREQSFLLDFAQYPAKLGQAAGLGETITPNKSLEKLGMRALDIRISNANQLLDLKLEQWKNHRTEPAIALIKRVKSELLLIATNHRIRIPTMILKDKQALCSQEEVETVALYYNQRVAISIPAWEKLDLVSQAGLLLHETLRHIQIKHNAQYTEDSERTLRDIVAHVMLFTPNEDSQFDFAKQAYKIIDSQTANLFDESAKVLAEFCKESPKWLPILKTTGRRLYERMRASDCLRDPSVTPRDFRRTEDYYSAHCMMVNGVYFNVAEDTREQSRDYLRHISTSIEGGAETYQDLDGSVARICSETDFSVLARNGGEKRLAGLRSFMAATTVAARSRTVKKPGMTQAELKRYDKALDAPFMYLVIMGTSFSLHDLHQWDQRMADLGGRFEGISRDLMFEQLENYFNSFNWFMSSTEKKKIDKAVVELQENFKYLIERGVLF